MYLTGKTLAGCLLAGAKNKILFLEENRKPTTVESLLKIAELKIFRNLKRKLVLCIVDNLSESLIGYLAFMLNEAVCLVAGSAISKKNLSILYQKYLPEYVWMPTERIREISSRKQLFSHGAYSLVKLDQTQNYEINQSLGILISTSGSTGSPKYVRLSENNIMKNALAIAEYLEITPSEKPITTMPPNYAYGLSIIHSHLFCGAPIILTNRSFFHCEFWKILKTNQATTLSGVPFHFDMLKKIKFFDMTLPCIKTVTQAGGRMSPEAAKDFALGCAKKNIRFFAMYGQAEATARMSFLRYQRAVEKAGSIGQAIPGGEFWLEDESGKRIRGHQEIGELVYRGENVCMGYAESFSDLCRRDESGGILRTGDLAWRDAEGDFYIAGRKKRFLKIFGHRVNLQDVEDLLFKAGHETACNGIDDSLEIFVVKPAESEPRAIKEKIIAELRLAPRAVKVYAITKIPRNEAGKIQYSQLAQSGASALA